MYNRIYWKKPAAFNSLRYHARLTKTEPSMQRIALILKWSLLVWIALLLSLFANDNFTRGCLKVKLYSSKLSTSCHHISVILGIFYICKDLLFSFSLLCPKMLLSRSLVLEFSTSLSFALFVTVLQLFRKVRLFSCCC